MAQADVGIAIEQAATSPLKAVMWFLSVVIRRYFGGIKIGKSHNGEYQTEPNLGLWLQCGLIPVAGGHGAVWIWDAELDVGRCRHGNFINLRGNKRLVYAVRSLFDSRCAACRSPNSQPCVPQPTTMPSARKET